MERIDSRKRVSSASPRGRSMIVIQINISGDCSTDPSPGPTPPANSSKMRKTESDEGRLTEAGELRITEGEEDGEENQ